MALRWLRKQFRKKKKEEESESEEDILPHADKRTFQRTQPYIQTMQKRHRF